MPSCTGQVLLMSGPPGLGKTTLANIIAAQAGYNILEINARCASLSSSLAGLIFQLTAACRYVQR
jgi:Holliday junction resolvasome RuvABC ATP-dependent DNA helicase subunit